MKTKVERWESEFPFPTLPDYLQHGLAVVFIGINPGLYSVAKGHYFARSTSRFWPAFSRSKLSEVMRTNLGVDVLLPERDSQLTRFGFGLTDVVKKPSANMSGLTPEDFAYWAPQLLNKLLEFKPRVACFHGVTAYRWFLQAGLRRPKTKLIPGAQAEILAGTRIFVAPNPSPANAHFTPAEQTASYNDLERFLGES